MPAFASAIPISGDPVGPDISAGQSAWSVHLVLGCIALGWYVFNWVVCAIGYSRM